MSGTERNTAAHTDGGEGIRKHSRLRTAAAIIGVAVALAVIVLVLLSIQRKQKETLKRLNEEKAAKEQELLEIELKKDSLLERMSVIGSRQYLIRYLREHQGYMFPGDIRIDVDDPHAAVPTPVPQYTPEPVTPEPTETGEPEPGVTSEPTEEPTGEPGGEG